MAWGTFAGIILARKSFEQKKKAFSTDCAEIVVPYIELGRAYLSFGARAKDEPKRLALAAAAQIFEEFIALLQCLQSKQREGGHLAGKEELMLRELSRNAHEAKIFAAQCHDMLDNPTLAESLCVDALIDANKQLEELGSSEHLIEAFRVLSSLRQGHNFNEACFCCLRSLELSMEAFQEGDPGRSRQLSNVGDRLSKIAGDDTEGRHIFLDCALVCYKLALLGLDINSHDRTRFESGGKQVAVAAAIDSILQTKRQFPSIQTGITTLEDVTAQLSSMAAGISTETFLRRWDSKICQHATEPPEQFAASAFLNTESLLSKLLPDTQDQARGSAVQGTGDATPQGLALGCRVKAACPSSDRSEIAGTCIELCSDGETAVIGLRCGREISIPHSDAIVIDEFPVVQELCTATGLPWNRIRAIAPTIRDKLAGSPGARSTDWTATEAWQLCSGVIEHAQACKSLSLDTEKQEFSIALELGFLSLALARRDEDKDAWACALNRLGNSFDGLGMYEHAKAKYKQSLELIEDSWLSANPERSLPTHANLAITLFKLGEFKEGEHHFRQANPRRSESEVQQHLRSGAQGLRSVGEISARGDASWCLCTENSAKDYRHALSFMGRLHQEQVLFMPGIPGPKQPQKKVELCGLRNNPELNGRRGVVQGFADQSLAVALDPEPGLPARVLKVKPAKLRVVDPSSRFNLSSEFNPETGPAVREAARKKTAQPPGAVGDSGPIHQEQMEQGVPSFTPAKTQTQAETLGCSASSSPTSTGRPTQLESPVDQHQPATLVTSLAPGDAVKLQGLKRDDLNGQQGQIQGEQRDGRYHVRLSSGKDILIRPANCCVCQEESTEDKGQQPARWAKQYLTLLNQARGVANLQGHERAEDTQAVAEAAGELWREFSRSVTQNQDGEAVDISLFLASLVFDCWFSLSQNVQLVGLELLGAEMTQHALDLLDVLQARGRYLSTDASSLLLMAEVAHHGKAVNLTEGDTRLAASLIEGKPFTLWSAVARAWVLIKRADAAHKLGDYGTSLKFGEEAKVQVSKCNRGDLKALAGPAAMQTSALALQATCDHQLAHSYRRCGKVQQAIAITKSTLETIAAFEQQQGSALPQILPFPVTTGLKAQALMNLGAYHYDIDAFEEAAAYNKRALDICTLHPAAIADHHFESVVLGNQGNALSRLGRSDEAQSHRRKAIQRLEKLKPNKAVNASLARIKCAYAKGLSSTAESVRALEEAYKVAKSAEEAVLIPTVAGALAYGIRRAGGDPARAESVLLEGLEVCERMQASLTSSDELRISLFERQQELYQELQRLLVSAQRPQDALCAAERSKARALAHLMTADDTDGNDELSWAMVQELVRGEGCPTVLFSMVPASAIENHAIMSWVLSASGSLICFRSTSLTPERLHQVQGTLSDGHAVASQRGAVLSAVDSVTRGRLAVGHQDDVSEKLRAMYDLLIAPVADALPGSSEVLIIPHLQLFMVPWAALMDDKEQYLAQRFAIRLSPSLRIAHAARSKAASQRVLDKKIFVGNPWPLPPNVPGGDLTALPFAEQEVQGIVEQLGGDGSGGRILCATGIAASKGKVQAMMTNATWVHLACHGLLEEQALVLSGEDASSGLLSMGEVKQTTLSSGCSVVLSACNSGRGEILGEGVVGLARAFLASGASAALVTLWHIPDESTKAFMSRLYRRLQVGMRLPQAMQMSMLAMAGKATQPAFGKDTAAQCHALCSWTSEEGRVERTVVERLFNGARPLTYRGGKVAMGNGLTASGHVSDAAYAEVFGHTHADGCPTVWGWRGLSRAWILATSGPELQLALGSVACIDHEGSQCSHAKCARNSRPSSGLLLLLHLLVCRGAADGAVPDLVEESILLVQERLARLGDRDLQQQHADGQHRKPKHWASFVLVGASTSLRTS